MIGSDIERATNLLRSGEVVALPTETVYGLAAHAHKTEAIEQIFQIKNRPQSNPLILHVAHLSDAKKYAQAWTAKASALAQAFWPGPLTLVLPKSDKVDPVINAGLEQVAIRMPRHNMIRQVISNLGAPIVAPSANLYGQVSPTLAEHVERHLGDKIPYILDGGPCSEGLESTIVAVSESKCTVLRHGSLPVEYIEKVVGPTNTFIEATETPIAPGMVPFHYAPTTPISIIKAADISTIPSTVKGMLISQQPAESGEWGRQEIMSPSDAAKKLYACLHEADNAPVIEHIYFIPFEEAGVGRAINDRMKRAAAKFRN